MKPVSLKVFGIPLMQFGSLPDPGPVPGRQTKFLSPRYEPSNITQHADVIRVQEAIRLAENGDTQELYRFYRDVLLSDDHIQACFNTRKLAVLAQPTVVLPYDKNNNDDVGLAAAFTQAIDDCENWEMGLLALQEGTMFPNSVVERLFCAAQNQKLGASSPESALETLAATPAKPKAKKPIAAPPLQYTLKKFVPVNPQLHCYQWAYLMGGVGLGTASAVQLGNLAGELNKGQDVADNASPYTIDLEKWEPYLKLWPIDNAGRIIYDVTNACYLDPARHVVHRGHLLQNYRDNWGGPFRCILMLWLWRRLGLEWFGRGMERYGSPFPVAYTDANDPEAVALLREAMDLAKKIGGLVVDESSRIELKEAMVAGMAQGYETYVRIIDEAISFHITGLRTAQKPGGLNAGESTFSSNVREDVRMFDQILLGKTIVSQVVKPFAQINGLAGRVKVVWGGLSDDDASVFADLLVKMKTAGYQLADESIPTANERTGLTWERAVDPAQAGPAGAKPVDDGDDLKGFSARLSRLSWLSATSAPAPTPVDPIVAKHSAALAQTFRGALAPVRLILLSSTSRAEAEKKLAEHFADWPAAKIAQIMEEAMQVCAAKGASAGKAES